MRPDLTGRRFGRLVAIAPAERPARVTGPTANRRRFWSLQCNCGATRVACHRDLLSGHTRSCGCLRREVAAASGRRQAELVTWDGEMLTLAQWSARTGMAARQLRERLRAGWSVEQVLTTPVRRWVRRAS